MVFQKKIEMNSPVVIGNSVIEKDLFRPGFCYRIAGLTYTVVRDATKEPNSELRELNTSDGSTEIVSISTIVRDLKEEQAEELPVDKRFVEHKPEEVKEAPKDEPKKTKKKTKRKRAKAKRTKNG